MFGLSSSLNHIPIKYRDPIQKMSHLRTVYLWAWIALRHLVLSTFNIFLVVWVHMACKNLASVSWQSLISCGVRTWSPNSFILKVETTDVFTKD